MVYEKARELGFDDCRVTTAAAPPHAREFRDWIAAGKHGTMGYLERNAFKRVDPNEVLAGARSVVVLAVAYGGERGKEGADGGGTVGDKKKPRGKSEQQLGLAASRQGAASSQ